MELDFGVHHRSRLDNTRGLTRIARGWYATPDADPQAVQAIQKGARLGCISAMAPLGLWIPPDQVDTLHLAVATGDPLPDLPYVCISRVPRRLKVPAVDPLEALAEILKNHDTETALILLESAVNKEVITAEQAWSLIGSQTMSLQRQLRHFTPGAQSGSETRVRLFLQQRGVKVAIQPFVRGVGKVDILVGNSLIIECDSLSHHTLDREYHEDRARDLESNLQGYTIQRLSYRQIWYQWVDTQFRLAKLLKRRVHRRIPKGF